MKKYHGPKDRLEAAQSYQTSKEELHELAKSQLGFVHRAVAANQNAQIETLAQLVPETIETYGPSQGIALALAQNPNTPAETLAVLGERLLPVLDNGRNHQVGFQAGMVLCSNPKTPSSTIELILNAEKSAMQFRKVVARESNRRDVLEMLLKDRSEKVRCKAENRMGELGYQ